MSMFFGLSGVDVFCCLTCNTPPQAADFPGGWWGLSAWSGGCYATRLPSFVTDPSHVEFDSLGRYVWRVRHETDSVLIPDVVEGGVTYRCVGSPGSQYADGSWFAPAKASIVVYQLHFAPLDDLATTTPRAGLAFVKVGDHTTGAQESDPGNHECTLLGCWLVNDRNGDPEHWDSPRKLCHFFTNGTGPPLGNGVAYKTLVGPEHFAFQERRLPGGIDRVVYYALDQATPTVAEWDNVEEGTESAWKPLFFSATAFPWGLWTRCSNVTYYESGVLQGLSRQYCHGKAALPGMTLDTSRKESNIPAYPTGDWSGEDEPEGSAEDLTINLSDTAVYVIDCELAGRYRPPVDATETVTLHLSAASSVGFDEGNYAYGGVWADSPSFYPTPMEGLNYAVGSALIAVSRSGSAYGFGFFRDYTSAFGPKQPWRESGGLSVFAGEGASGFNGEILDPPYYLAPERVNRRLFGCRHNAWSTKDGYWPILMGSFYFVLRDSDGDRSIVANPSGAGFPVSEISAPSSEYDDADRVIVQDAYEGFAQRVYNASGDPQIPIVTVCNWPVGLTPAEDFSVVNIAYLDYAGNNDTDPYDPPADGKPWMDSAFPPNEFLTTTNRLAVNWFYAQNTDNFWAPLWRQRSDNKLLANRVCNGWYYQPVYNESLEIIDYTLHLSGNLAYHAVLDDLRESGADAGLG